MSEILACIDFSDASVAVLAEAARLATASNDRVHVIHVAAAEPEIAGYDTGPIAAHTRDDRALELLDEHRQLRDIADSLRESGLDVTPLLVMGETTGKILEEADRLDASTIVLGSHGHGRLHHLLLGSVSEGVLRHTKRPVVVVPVAER
jgi:nucleotide-binding universal stress UspA family protein